ncbi:TetR/AcrR family transcriptional regulator [Actinokineospora sp. HUAS TT18]|uniref:TetR/AcrR family transcriptional regulator n=1 Tax=Actinokineospora sp. HUAS TT18 TaxID=3447451 RepID=UPI003F522CB3
MTTTEHSGSGDLNRSLELLWDYADKPGRGRKPGLTLDRIVAAAVAVADADGLEAVSMRRIASDLDVGAMSLYRYIPGKAELLDLMLDQVCAVVPPAEPPSDWRAAVELIARGSMDMYLAHPWMLQVDQARPVLGPNALAGLDLALSWLADVPLSDQQKICLLVTVDGFVSSTARTTVNAQRAFERTGVTDEEFWTAQSPILEKAMATGTYPMMAGLADNAFSPEGIDLFDFGLGLLLDGLAAFLSRS